MIGTKPNEIRTSSVDKYSRDTQLNFSSVLSLFHKQQAKGVKYGVLR